MQVETFNAWLLEFYKTLGREAQFTKSPDDQPAHVLEMLAVLASEVRALKAAASQGQVAAKEGRRGRG